MDKFTFWKLILNEENKNKHIKMDKKRKINTLKWIKKLHLNKSTIKSPLTVTHWGFWFIYG